MKILRALKHFGAVVVAAVQRVLITGALVVIYVAGFGMMKLVALVILRRRGPSAGGSTWQAAEHYDESLESSAHAS